MSTLTQVIAFKADLGANQSLKFEWVDGQVRVTLLHKDRPQIAGIMKLDDLRTMLDTFEALEAKGERVTALVAVNE